MRAPRWTPYLTDRKLIGLTITRLGLCVFVVASNVTVAVPTAEAPLPLEVFLALAFALPAAVSMPERLQWIARGRAGARLRMLRTSLNLGSDCAAAVVVYCAVGITHAVVYPAGSLLVLGVAYAVAAYSARLAWLAAAALGTVGLLTLSHSPLALIDQVPLWLGVGGYLAGFATSVAIDPRDTRRD